MKRLISRIFTAVLVAMTCFAIPGPVALADTTNVNPSVNCATAPNPDECMREQTLGKWSSTDPLNYFGNRDLLKSGPFTASVKYDDQLSWILGLGYVHMLGEAAGIALKAGLGMNELRANATAGWAITDRQQVKLTYEYLKQNLPFDFASGTVDEWVSQNAIGGAYQYLLRKGIVHSLELSGSFISAGSKELPEILFDIDPDTQALNFRRIAGGKEATAMAAVNLMPHTNTSLVLGAGYSGVNYDTKLENDQNARAIAFKAEMAHILNPRLKLETGVNNTAASIDSKVTISKLLPKNFEVAVSGLFSQGRGNIQDSKTVMLGLSYPAPKSYAINGLDKLTELKNWIEKPVVYVARVLAVKDEGVSVYAITTSQDLPDQTVPEGQGITAIETEDYFQFDPTIYDQVDYTFTVQAMPNTPEVNGDDLNLELVQDTPYQATLQSAAPLPYGTSGQYSITITATGEKTGLKQSVTKSDTFILDVQPIGAGWTDKTLPTAPMGVAYPDVELNDGYVISNIPNDTFTFSIVTGPSWLQVKDGHVLTAADGSVVPQNVTSVPVTLKVVNSDNQPSQKDFTVSVNEQLPIWNQTADYQNWSIAYDDTTGGIPLQSYITTGNSNLTFSFANNQLTSGNWTIVNNNGSSYLRRTTPSTPLPNDVGTTANLSIVAHNSTSTADNQEKNAVQKVSVNILQDTNLPAPGWNTNQLAANAGDTSYKVDLAPMVNGSITTDTYTFTLDNKGNTWLQLSSDGQSLISNGAVPPQGTGSTGDVKIAITATSQASGKPTQTNDFTVTVSNFAPVWLDPPPADKVKISYDATPGNTSTPGVVLNELISQNTTNLNFAFSSDGQQKTSGDGKWTIVTEGGNNVLRLTQPDSSLIGTTVPVKVFALNSTSNGGVDYDLPITVTGDANQPGASWNNNALNGTTAGTNNYNDTVKKLFDCPTGDTCTIAVDLKTTASWLAAAPNADSTDITLTSTNAVPAAASDTNGVSAPLHVTVTSRISGKVIDQDFTIPVTNVLPEWSNSPTGSLIYDGSSPDTTVPLNPAIKTGTDAGISFAIDPSFAGKDNWTIIKTGNDYYLQRTADSDINDIDNSPVSVPIIAKNTTSQNGAPGVALITILVDGGLPAPAWTNNQLAATAGDTTYKVALAPLVKGSADGDSYTFALDNKGNTWLELSADGQSLVTNAAVPPQGTNATGDVHIVITATSKASGKPTPTNNNDFTLTVTNLPPVWVADTISSQNIEYNATMNASVEGISLNSLIKANTTNLTFAFSADGKAQTSSDGKWTIVQEGNGYALKLMQEDVNDIGKTATVRVYALNSTSNPNGDFRDIPIVIIGDATQPGASWNSNTLNDTMAGATTYNDAVKKLFDCPTDDICTVTVDLKTTANWLAATPTYDGNNNIINITLTSTNAVPAAASDTNGVSDPIHVTVTSHISGKEIDKDFTIPITNILPDWKDPPLSDTLMFDGKSPAVRLNQAIATGTDSGVSFSIDPNWADKDNWQIIQTGSDYYLQRAVNSNTDDIGSQVSVQLIAKNTTSQSGVEGKVLIEVQPDTDLVNGITFQGTPAGTTAGSDIDTYNTSLNDLFTCAIGDTCEISVDLGQNSSWLEANFLNDGKEQATLSNSAIVPAIQDPNGNASFVLTITSLGSGGLTKTKSFDINVASVSPEWDSSVPVPGVIYDGTSPSDVIHLNAFIKPVVP